MSFSLKAILTIGVLAALVSSIEPGALFASLRQAHWTWVLIAALLVPLNLALNGWVWKQLLITVVDRVSPRTLAGALLSGLALGFWTPARAGEYAGRAFYLSSGDRWSISLTVFAQRMIDMMVGVNVGLLALGWAFGTGVLPLSTPWMAAAAMGLGTGALLTAFAAMPARVHHLARWLVPNRPGLTKRTVLFERLSRRQGLVVVGGSLARYVVFTGQFALLGHAFAPSAPWSLLAGAASLTFYAKYLIPSLTVLDLGIREGGAALFFQLLGLAPAAGLNAALVLFSMNVLGPAALGLLFVPGLQLGRDSEPVDAHAPAPVSGS